MTAWGILASPEAWEVVRPAWDGASFPLGFVSYSPDDATRLLADGGVSFLLIEARGDLLLPALVSQADGAGVEVVALITSPLSDEIASRVGIDKRVRQPEDLHRLGPREAPVSSADSLQAGMTGVVVAVWGPTGSPGRTTVATSLGALCSRKSLSTVVIDADSRSGAIAPALGHLDEVPGFVAACRLADRHQLVGEDLTRLAHRYDVSGSPIDVLSGVNGQRIHPEVTPDTIHDVITMAKSLWDVVIVDTGSDGASPEDSPQPTQWVVTTLMEVADDVVALCWASPVGVARFARVLDDVLARRKGKPLRVLMNGVDTSRRSLNDEAALREALRRFAGVNSPGIIPRDGQAVRKAEMAGLALPEAEPTSPIVTALSPLVSGWANEVLARRSRFAEGGVRVNGNPNQKLRAKRATPPSRQPGRGSTPSGSVMGRLKVFWDRALPLR